VDSVLVELDGLLNWGDGNITDDPLFVNEEEGDYRLTSNSPCIDAGDPDDPMDADSSRADIGALAFFGRGFLKGFVRAMSDSSALVGATVRTSYDVVVTTDEQGYWEIPLARVGVFSLTASAEGYADSTLPDTTLESRDTLEFIFSLRCPGFAVAPDSIATELDTSIHSAQFAVTVSNTGDAPLEWSARPHNRGESGYAPWEVRREKDLGWGDNETFLRGAVFAEDRFYCFIRGNDSTRVDVFRDLDSERVGSFGLDNHFTFYDVDLEWDGELIWAARASQMIGFDLEGNIMYAVDYPDAITGIAFDRETGEYWFSFGDDIVIRYDRNFNYMEEWALPQWRITGLAFRPDDPDGCPLYVYHWEGDSLLTAVIDKVNLDSHEAITLWSYTPDFREWRYTGSAQMTDEYDQFGGWVMVTTSQETYAASYLEVRQVEEATWWLQLDVPEGVLQGGEEQEIALTINRDAPDGRVLRAGVYEGEIIFTHNAADGEAILPVTLTVEKPDGIADCRLQIEDFKLNEPRPNPFNSSLAVSYQLSAISRISLKLYDISGRLVSNQELGINNPGIHRTVIDGSELASGVYFLKLAAGNRIATRKIVCVK
jgi:hypothetical protein